jgi:hypothetical protein
VCDQNAGKTPKSEAGAQDLALCAFATVNQEALIPVGDDLCRKATVNRWRRGGRAQKGKFEQ